MRIAYKDLEGVAVETESGEGLGKLVDVTLDLESYRVTHVAVAKSRLLSKLLPSELSVAVEQIVSVSKEKIVVRDGVVEEEAARSAVIAAERAAGAGVHHRAAAE
jgi:sporulation protein YlmC with PRC-barrel domain